MSSKSNIFKKGTLDIAPHLLSVIPFGIIFGAIGIELGFDPYLIYGTSLIIFGGIRRIGHVTARLVPAMVILYLVLNSSINNSLVLGSL